MATDEDLGDDWAGVDDITPGLDDASGRLALLQCVARRWYDLAGSLWFDPNYGQGLSMWLNDSVINTSSIESALEDEARKDERVEKCSVTVRFADETMTIRGRITDADGPFAFTVAASALNVTTLLENAIT